MWILPSESSLFRVILNSVLSVKDFVVVANGWRIDRGLAVPSIKIASSSDLLDMVEQTRKEIWIRVTRLKVEVRLQLFFFLLWFVIEST